MVLSEFALTFPCERPQRILRTGVAWARCATLLKYSGTRRVSHGLQQPAATQSAHGLTQGKRSESGKSPVGFHPIAAGRFCGSIVMS